MGFRVNWKLSDDFPYMGMFLPPVGDREPYRRIVKGNLATIAGLRESTLRWRRAGFPALCYFNVTEFGRNMRWPAPPRSGLEIDVMVSFRCEWQSFAGFIPTVQLWDGAKLRFRLNRLGAVSQFHSRFFGFLGLRKGDSRANPRKVIPRRLRPS